MVLVIILGPYSTWSLPDGRYPGSGRGLMEGLGKPY